MYFCSISNILAGIYIHIPFCKQACNYCNFHFSTNLSYRQQMVDSICTEISNRTNYLAGEPIETIYLGGGTPSILSPKELTQIFKTLDQYYHIATAQEITIEANPDDINHSLLSFLKNDSPVNRLSIGIQSFFKDELKFMNRAHSAKEAKQCIDLARQYDFENLSADLIYGSPLSNMQKWEKNLSTLTDLKIPHLSAYCLTVEEKTALHHQIKSGQRPALDDELASEQFLFMQDYTAQKGYIAYEISNLALEGHFALHNSNYWKGKSYLGIGPGAHSFNGNSRLWNLSNNSLYLKNMELNQPFSEEEILSKKDRYNEYVMTGLRTIWGLQESNLKQFDASIFTYFEQQVKPFIKSNQVNYDGQSYRLNKEARLQADGIASELFVI